MKKKFSIIFWTFSLLMLLTTACGLNEKDLYDLKYIHIMLNEASTTTVSAKARTIGSYNVFLSSGSFNESVEVTYEIEVGDGLKQGIDYNLLTTGNKLTFLPGIYDMPIRIQWLPNENMDPTKNNTIKITLLSNNKGYSIGFPGPDHNQSSFIITKLVQ
jgi:hypothetical protein